MKILVTVSLSLICLQAFASRPVDLSRPEGNRRSRGVEASAKLETAVKDFQSRTNRILEQKFGETVEIKIPEGLTRSEQRDYAQKFQEAADTMARQDVVARLKNNEGNLLSNLKASLTKMNDLYEARPEIVTRGKAEKDNWTEIEAKSQELWVKMVDNRIRQIDIELANYGTPKALSFRTLETVDNFLLSAKPSGMRGQDFVEINNRITEVLPREFNMEKAANCVKAGAI